MFYSLDSIACNQRSALCDLRALICIVTDADFHVDVFLRLHGDCVSYTSTRSHTSTVWVDRHPFQPILTWANLHHAGSAHPTPTYVVKRWRVGLHVRSLRRTRINFAKLTVLNTHACFRRHKKGSDAPVSYTHLTLPTKRIV